MTVRFLSFLLLVFSASLLNSCSNNKSINLDEEVWAELLFDMHVLGVSMSDNYEQKDVLYDSSWTVLEEKYQLNRPQIQMAYNHLLTDEKKTAKVYDVVLERINTSEQNFYKSLEKLN